MTRWPGRPAVVVSEEPLTGDIPCLVLTGDARLLLAQAAARFYGFPSRRMSVTGITGTNGKTTVSYLIESIVRASGAKAGVIGTISYRYNGCEVKGANTTPESVEIQSLFARHESKEGCATLRLRSPPMPSIRAAWKA